MEMVCRPCEGFRLSLGFGFVGLVVLFHINCVIVYCVHCEAILYYTAV